MGNCLQQLLAAIANGVRGAGGCTLQVVPVVLEVFLGYTF